MSLMKDRSSFFCSICCLLILVSLSGEISAADRLQQQMDRSLEELRIETGFPGATLALALPDGRVLVSAAGVADLESCERMPVTARMFSGSVGKTFAAALTLLFVQEGRLGLEDSLCRFLGDREWFDRLPNGSALTLRMLLNHTSGLPRYVYHPGLWKALNAEPDRVFSPEECISFILGTEPVHAPGRGWSYSDTNYLLIGLVLEKICGRSYYEELHDRILGPLGLEDTEPSIRRTIPDLPSGYTGEGEPFFLPVKVSEKGFYAFNPAFEWTGGGLVTSSRDLALWALKLYGGQVLSREMTKAMLSPVNTGTGEPADAGYGLGVQIDSGGSMAGHGGIFPGYQSQMAYNTELKVGIAMQVNADRLSGKWKGSLYAWLARILGELEPFLSD